MSSHHDVLSNNRASNPEDDSEDHSSDSEDVDDLPEPVVMPRANAGLEEYKTALKSSQVQFTEIRNMLRDLKLENATLKMNQPKRRAQPDDPNIITQNHEVIQQLGKRFGVMYEAWAPDTGIFSSVRSEDVDPNNAATRYLSTPARNAAILAEIYSITPRKLHGVVSHSSFISQFRHHLNNARGSHLTNLRNSAAELFDMPSTYFKRRQRDHQDKEELQKLLKFKVDDKKYPRFSPMFYPNNVKKDKLLFRVRLLVNILRVVLLGPSSLTSSKRGGPPGYASRWGIVTITPGAIAWAATMAKFLASPDESFEPIGATSGIHYSEDFAEFKRLLIANSASPVTKSLIQFFNNGVLSGAMDNVMNIPMEAGEEEELEMDEAMRAFEESEEELETETIENPSSNIGTTHSKPSSYHSTRSTGTTAHRQTATHKLRESPDDANESESESSGPDLVFDEDSGAIEAVLPGGKHCSKKGQERAQVPIIAGPVEPESDSESSGPDLVFDEANGAIVEEAALPVEKRRSKKGKERAQVPIATAEPEPEPEVQAHLPRAKKGKGKAQVPSGSRQSARKTRTEYYCQLHAFFFVHLFLACKDMHLKEATRNTRGEEHIYQRRRLRLNSAASDERVHLLPTIPHRSTPLTHALPSSAIGATDEVSSTQLSSKAMDPFDGAASDEHIHSLSIILRRRPRIRFHPAPLVPPTKPSSIQPSSKAMDPFYGHEQSSKLCATKVHHAPVRLPRIPPIIIGLQH
ncbi:hypothetical protein BJ138DRAFT_1237336 [Hygrophoropsis aurantiaca]|uniref:Uncharacterized protein n=1 Tax=Hygrophoropsis aurantiaca TaxID=72124 RepID=A0ACB7ZUX6_9AGAM|nr:hypothetical protein BJ138DRAFT_1237336 [Hygrophoropsis aurantiaca]